MERIELTSWINTAPLWLIAFALFGSMCVAAFIAAWIRDRRARGAGAKPVEDKEESGDEGYLVSAVLGLLALLLGFTFSLAVDRYDTRRLLVRDEANAIGAAYRLAGLLDEPNRQDTRKVMVAYLDNRIALGRAHPGVEQARLLAVNNALIADLWTQAAAAFPAIKGYDWSSTYLDAVNQVVELDASRKLARVARVPSAVFDVLFVYMITSAFVLGYVLRGQGRRIAASFLMGLFVLALVLIIDVDRPTSGGVVESQLPMEMLRAQISAEMSPAPVR